MNSRRNPRILLVEDNDNFREMLAMSLKMYQFEVATARNGAAALEQFKENGGAFAAVITDAEMPIMNGLELVTKLRAEGYQGRIILMSGNLSRDELLMFADLNLGGFFNKPFSPQMLAQLLKGSN